MIVEKELKTEEKANEFAKDLYLSLLRGGKSVYVNAWGTSMYPFIKDGDRIKIEPINKEEIRIGDIVAVNIKNEEGPWFFAHRVVKIIGDDRKGRIYFTKGDAHKRGLDSPVTMESIAGKITQIQRRNLEINLELSLWGYVNYIIAKFSFKYPKILHFVSGYISLIVEWKWFLFKLRNRFKKGNPLVYNTEELLLICARRDLNEELKKKAQGLIKEGVDWEDFCESAMRGGVTILVYNALRKIASCAHIPVFVLNRLKSGYIFIASRVASQHKELIELLKLFAEHGIPVVPLKGTLLAKRLYGDIAARGLNADIDLLIRWEDREKVHKTLIKNGYKISSTKEIEQWLWQESCGSPGSHNVDLIYDIWMRGYNKQAIAGLWNGVRMVTEDSSIIYSEFKEEELLIYMAAYLVTCDNGYKCLKYTCDINEFLSLYIHNLNWLSVINKVKNWQLESSLFAALVLVKDLFGSNVPLYAVNSVKPHFLKRIFIRTFFNRKVMLRENTRRRIMTVFLMDIFFELIEARSVKEYLTIFKRVFFPPKEIVRNRSYISRIFKGIAKLLPRFIDL